MKYHHELHEWLRTYGKGLKSFKTYKKPYEIHWTILFFEDLFHPSDFLVISPGHPNRHPILLPKPPGTCRSDWGWPWGRRSPMEIDGIYTIDIYQILAIYQWYISMVYIYNRIYNIGYIYYRYIYLSSIHISMDLQINIRDNGYWSIPIIWSIDNLDMIIYIYGYPV